MLNFNFWVPCFQNHVYHCIVIQSGVLFPTHLIRGRRSVSEPLFAQPAKSTFMSEISKLYLLHFRILLEKQK